MIQYDGFHDLAMKEDLSTRHTKEDEESWIVHELVENLPQAKSSDFSFRNRSSRKSITTNFELDIPEYADVTGKRIFLQPAVFQKDSSPLFTEDQRLGDILFPYPWKEIDDISIQIPEGFSLEEGSAPQPIKLGALGMYEVKLGLTKSKVVKYKRTFSMNLRFAEKKFYDSIKGALTIVNQLDQHALTFKRQETEAN
jgi:hypothetical protein